jgi:hypothetical protein
MAKALIYKLQFLEEPRETLQHQEIETEDMGKLPLKEVSEWTLTGRTANSNRPTVERECRMFQRVLDFFGSECRAKSIGLAKIRQYQQARRAHVSNTMKREVSARTVNYEIQLLPGVMTYAGCWKGDLVLEYKPLRQTKKRVGKVASKEQLLALIAAAKKKDYWQLAMYCAAVAVETGCRAVRSKTCNFRIEQESGWYVALSPSKAQLA